MLCKRLILKNFQTDFQTLIINPVTLGLPYMEVTILLKFDFQITLRYIQTQRYTKNLRILKPSFAIIRLLF